MSAADAQNRLAAAVEGVAAVAERDRAARERERGDERLRDAGLIDGWGQPARQLTQFGFRPVLRKIEGLAGLFTTRVPDRFWIVVDAGVAEVSCPCGTVARCREEVPEPCACQRWFLYAPPSMRVALSPVGEDDAGLPEPEPEPPPPPVDD